MCGGALTADITQKLNQLKIIIREQEEGRHAIDAWNINKSCSARGHAKFSFSKLVFNFQSCTKILRKLKIQEEVGDSGEMEQSFVELFSDKLNRETMVCPNCGRMLNRRDVHERTVETMIGEIKLRRPYFYYTNCKKGIHPLDDVLILSDTVKQWDMHKIIRRRDRRSGK